jgi:hypothetical protein
VEEQLVSAWRKASDAS